MSNNDKVKIARLNFMQMILAVLIIGVSIFCWLDIYGRIKYFFILFIFAAAGMWAEAVKARLKEKKSSTCFLILSVLILIIGIISCWTAWR